jgi:hypothetical protein
MTVIVVKTASMQHWDLSRYANCWVEVLHQVLGMVSQHAAIVHAAIPVYSVRLVTGRTLQLSQLYCHSSCHQLLAGVLRLHHAFLALS